MDMLSIIVTLYNSASFLDHFADDINRLLNSANKNYEFIFIDNGSLDSTLSKLKTLSEKNYRCHFISLHHNLSLIETYYIGMQYAQGEYILFMDIHHPVYMIRELYKALTGSHVSCAAGLLQENNHSKKQRYFKMYKQETLSEYIIEQDYEGFKSLLKHTYSDICWISYRNLEENKTNLLHLFLAFLNQYFGLRFIYLSYSFLFLFYHLF